jgi:hypothetical protein
MNSEDFDRLWRQSMDSNQLRPEKKEQQCIYAQRFAPWADGLVQDEMQEPTPIGINQKMLLLTKKYFDWRAAVPKSHRERIGERSHVCIFHIFERTYHRLRVLELSLTPPMLFLPPPAPLPAPVVHSIAGITLGEVMGE